MSFEESALLQRRYEAGLASYTYLARETEDTPAATNAAPPAATPAPQGQAS